MAGLILTIIVNLLSPLSQWITHTFITPEYFENIRAYSVQEGMMTDEDAAAYYSLSEYILQNMIRALIMGVLTSAAAALFIRSENS